MKNLRILIGLLSISIMISCSSPLSSAEQMKLNEELKQLSIDIQEEEYQIVMTNAYPLNSSSLNNVLNGVLLSGGDNASRIDLTDRNDYITLNENLVKADLSYYGERRISSGYLNQDSAIVYTGIPVNYNNTVDYEKSHIDISYRISNQTESFNVNIRLFADMNATININSSHRSSIKYNGVLELINNL